MKRIGLFAGILGAMLWLSPLNSLASDRIMLLMVPREDGPVRLGLDVGSRHPTLLLSYKILSDGSVSLHGWSGTEWVNVTPESFAEGSFFPKQPDSAVLVWNNSAQLPEALMPREQWCPSAYIISTTETRPLLHLLGLQYDFKYDDWRWFSDNYRLPFNSINPDGLNVSWYHRRLGENLKRGDVAGGTDIQHLSILYGPQTGLQDELDAPGNTALQPTESETGGAQVDGADNPLTNAVPQAVVLGAGEASETAVDESPDTDQDSSPEEEE